MRRGKQGSPGGQRFLLSHPQQHPAMEAEVAVAVQLHRVKLFFARSSVSVIPFPPCSALPSSNPYHLSQSRVLPREASTQSFFAVCLREIERLPFPPALPQQSQQGLPDLLLSSLPSREFLSSLIKTQSFYGSGENAGPEKPIPAERVPLGHALGFLLFIFLFYSPFFCPPLALGLSSAQASARGSS